MLSLQRVVRTTVLAAVVFGLGLGSLATYAAAEQGYVGVKKCKMCHKKAEDGDQFGQWQSSAHAKAYEVLASDDAKAKAKGLGIDNPQTSPECLKCHATAFPVMANIATEKITLEEGVSCETCHGPGQGYQKKKTMQGISDGTIDGASLGLIKPDEKVCAQCHNSDNPFDPGFNFEEAYKKIAHPRPSGSAS